MKFQMQSQPGGAGNKYLKLINMYLPVPGSEDQAAHWGGEDAGAGGGAGTANHAAGAGDCT